MEESESDGSECEPTLDKAAIVGVMRVSTIGLNGSAWKSMLAREVAVEREVGGVGGRGASEEHSQK